jgi:hypothetical protein
VLKVTPNHISDDVKASDAIKSLLGWIVVWPLK